MLHLYHEISNIPGSFYTGRRIMATTTNNSTQEGSVRKRGKYWYYRFRMKEDDGTWILREFKGATTKRETEAMLRQALDDYRSKGFIFDAGNITVSELGDMWYQSEIEHSALTTNGRNDYKNVLRHIREHSLGSIPLKNVTCEHIQNYVDEKYFGKFDENGKQLLHAYSESHMRKQFVVLNGMFKYAVYPRRFLRENLMQYVKRRKKEKPVFLFEEDTEQRIPTISKEEYANIISFLEKDDNDHILALPIQIAYHTGLRAGEVCGLIWEDINFEEQYLTVKRTMYYDNESKCWELKVPKNGKTRKVDFGSTLCEILKNAKKEQLKNRIKYGSLYQNHFYQIAEVIGRQHCQIFTEISEEINVLSSRVTRGKFLSEHDKTKPLVPLNFVCSKDDGEMLTTQTLKWCNKVVQRKIPGMKHFHFHALRHTYASTLINHGANFKDVQELLGHSDIKITLNTYSHVTSHSRKKAVDIFEHAINQ